MKRAPMKQEDMVISEVWRWRLLTIWVVVFSLLTTYALLKVQDIADTNRASLCSIHQTHVTTDEALQVLMEKGGEDVSKIEDSIAVERAHLAELGCSE
jgi:hypothetical protein